MSAEQDLRPSFGTDGMRGRAGRPPMDPVTIRKVAAALGVWLHGRGGEKKRVVVGHDGRASAPWILKELAKGLTGAEVKVIDAGLLTTPALACITRDQDFDAGVMISASHNPAEDNGIKIFDADGNKLPEVEESRIADLALELEADPETQPRVMRRVELVETYFEHIRRAFPGLSLAGMTVALDAANGGGSRIAPAVLESFGAHVIRTGCSPDGSNINAGVGALHPAALASVVVAEGATLGLCLDGDGDRGIFVDGSGAVRDGDQVLALLGPAMLASGELPDATVVTTEMSNLGLKEALGLDGIHLLHTKVGDKYVVEAMRRHGLGLGGEPSGHVLFAGSGKLTGDGLFTALKLLALPEARNGGLVAAFARFQRFPQILLNVPVDRKPPLEDLPLVQATKAAVERDLGDAGRVVLRYSGTEDLCRVMVEGRDADIVHRHAEAIADAVRKALKA